MSKEYSIISITKNNYETDLLLEKYNSIISNLKRDIEEKTISFIDSDIYKLYGFCKEHPEFLPTETFEEFEEKCAAFINIIWGASTPQEEMEKLFRPRLPDQNNNII